MLRYWRGEAEPRCDVPRKAEQLWDAFLDDQAEPFASRRRRAGGGGGNDAGGGGGAVVEDGEDPAEGRSIQCSRLKISRVASVMTR